MPTIIGIGANFIPGIGPLASAAISGLATAAFSEGTTSERIGQGLLAGIGTWGMGKLGSMIGGAGAQAAPGQLAGTEGFKGQDWLGDALLTPSGETAFTWGQLQTKSPEAFKFLSESGINTPQLYNQAMAEMGPSFRQLGSTSEFMSDAARFGQRGGFEGPSLREAAASDVLNPMLAPSQAAAAYKEASPFGRLGYTKEGLGQIDMAWEPTAPGRLGLGEFATPLMAAMTGVPAMYSQNEEYDPPARRTYPYEGPFFPEDRRQILPEELPPGYIPGVSPQERLFARGGTRGKTVSGGLPTLYAENGSDIGSMAQAQATAAMAASRAPIAGFNPHGYSTRTNPRPEVGTGQIAATRSAGELAAMMNPDQAMLMGGLTSLVPMGPYGLALKGLGTALNMSQGGSLFGSFGDAPVSLGNFSSPNQVPFSPGHVGLGNVQPSMVDLINSGDMGTGEPVGPDDEELLYRRELAGGEDQRTLTMPGESYRPGVDPQHLYYAQEGTEGMTAEESIDVEMAAEVPSGIAATTGIMQGAPVEAQGDVEARLSERQVEEPQNPRERAIYDRAVLALQNELEPEVAQRAIDEFLEMFGPDALHMLQEMVRGERENGGTVETVSGETTVEEGDIQGPDVIAGKIVDPVTGEETANLRVGENEYIEPAASLVRRAQVAGLPPTPENGAMIRGEEERMLRQAVG